jgi:hypothetical protein
MVLPSEGSLFTAKPEPLADLLKGIHEHKIALPDFQRPWVWEPHMVRDLLISVAYRYPAGSLLTMPVTASRFALRPFQGAGEVLQGKPGLMVLDGQQRLTSLYQALYRHDGVHVGRRTYYFYLHVPTLLADPDGSIDIGDPFFERALFFVIEERDGRRVRYEGLQPLYELTTTEHGLAAGALPLHFVFDADGQLADWRKKYLIQRSNKDMDQYLALDEQWHRLVQPWLTRIRTYPFPVVELKENMPLNAICHIFEKVNSTGVPLDVFDLCTAILWSQGFRLNKVWSDTKAMLAPLLPMQPLSGTYFLQSLALLHSLERKRGGDAQVAVACRKQDLMALDRPTVERWWPVLIEGYKEAAAFMSENGILAERILPYSTLIIPLAAIFADLKHRKGAAHVGAAWPKVTRWYWCSVFSQRYSSQVEYASAQDYEQMLGWIEGGPPPGVVHAFTFRADALQEITSIRNAIYKGVLCLLARDGALDFGGGGKLSTALFFDKRQDHHHIFPLNALKTLGIADPRADTIVNKTLINAEVNRSIGGHLPASYVNNWRGKLGAGIFDHILTTHHIDPAVLASNEWTAFFRDRRERLRQLIVVVCGGTITPFSDANIEQVEPPDDDPELQA